MEKRKCKLCGVEFVPVRKHHECCSKQHRITFNNQRKKSGIHIHTDIFDRIQHVADGQEKSVEHMVNMALDKAFPAPMPLTENQIRGVE